jgi:methionyl-tRNA synthetase
LANVFGNFVNRITRFAAARLDSQVPAGAEPGALEHKLLADLQAGLRALTAHHEALEFRKAAQETRALWVLGNEYLQAAAPWTAIKTDPEAAALGVRIGLNLCAIYAAIAAPFAPNAAAAIAAALGLGPDALRWPDPERADLLDQVPVGSGFTPPDVLFRKIEDTDVATWGERFGAG